MKLIYDPEQPLDLGISLLMGQAFRWRQDGEWFCGVVRGNIIKARKVRDGVLEYHGAPGSDEPVGEILRDYLALDQNINAIYQDISRDPKIAELVKKYRGLRILRQEPWECLVAYCCSAPNNVPGISRLVEKLARNYGDSIELAGENTYTFPSPASLAELSEVDLRHERFGLHSSRIIKVAQDVAAGTLDLEDLRVLPYQEAKRRLMAYKGIKDKIANCVLLFSLGKVKAFPVDRHIGRALVTHCLPDLRESQFRKLEVRGQEHFGQYAGYAGQFLFHDMRLRATLGR